jgi:hypothetical protein
MSKQASLRRPPALSGNYPVQGDGEARLMLECFEEVHPMRLVGMILALAAIVWVLYQMAGGGEAETVIPVEYQQSLNKAQDVEQTLKDATQKSMQKAEQESGAD